MLLQLGDRGAEARAVLGRDVRRDVERVSCAKEFGRCCYAIGFGFVG